MDKGQTLPQQDKFLNKIYAFFNTIWKDKWKEGIDQEWLSNFSNEDQDVEAKEKLNMLYLLSKFMYFGNDELRQLLISLYRDLFKYPIIAAIRESNFNTLDSSVIENLYINELEASRFIGVGNPSESGVHILYYFRQENKLCKDLFINTSEIFSLNKITEKDNENNERTYYSNIINDQSIKRYIFIDDFCGSGSQATGYLKSIVENIKFLNSKIEINYLMLFSTQFGLDNIKSLNLFNRVESVFILDDTFKTFSENSRYYQENKTPYDIDKEFAKETAIKYGTKLFNPPLGYRNCELLLGLFHNTPDNSIPIFWSDESNWKPIFKRYNKIY
jgi:hypothetical protein